MFVSVCIHYNLYTVRASKERTILDDDYGTDTLKRCQLSYDVHGAS
jgi:hypothetical protein